jgi:AbrB family looped-hinge helix DNA binding protein
LEGSGLRAKAGVVGWSKLTRNGQITLPKAVREKLGVKPGGDCVQFLLTEGDLLVARKLPLNEEVEL